VSYFSHHIDSARYSNEWQALLDYIKTDWPKESSEHLGDLAHHIEAKALYVYTMCRHLMLAANSLAYSRQLRPYPVTANPATPDWRPIFVEAMMLLFPMIELVGEARQGNAPDDGSWRRLGAGFDWLIDPSVLPGRSSRGSNDLGKDAARFASLGQHMPSLQTGPEVRELYHLRNYFLHGLKNIGQAAQSFDMGAVKTCMNFEMPNAILQVAGENLLVYWNQLRSSDPDSLDWVTTTFP
jgi:hypothetical protein